MKVKLKVDGHVKIVLSDHEASCLFELLSLSSHIEEPAYVNGGSVVTRDEAETTSARLWEHLNNVLGKGF